MTLRTARSRTISARTVAAVLAGLLTAATLGTVADGPAGAAAAHPVMARSRVTAANLAAFFRSKNKVSKATVSIDALAGHYITEGADEGVAGDLAFAQSIVETGWFTFSTRVPGSFNNFSGLGAVDGGTGAASFSSAQLGVRAQIQHLRAYGDPSVTTAKLAHPVIDPRFSLVAPKGKAPTWEQFGNGMWATDPGYAAKVLNVYQQILDFAGVAPAVVSLVPFDTSTQAVTQAYADILGREPSSTERAAAVAGLNNGTTTVPQLLAGLVAGEGAVDAQPVVRLYLSALGRLPDRGGLQYWTRRHAAGVPILRLAQQFLHSSEYRTRYGLPNDSGYVVVLYRNVLDRSADPAGASYWVTRLAGGQTTRDKLLVQFSESSEHKTKTAATSEAAIVYLGMVLRAPDASVLSWWSTKRTAGRPLTDLTSLVLGSTAYLNRF